MIAYGKLVVSSKVMRSTYIATNKLLEEHDAATDSCALEGRPRREKGGISCQIQRNTSLAWKLLARILLLEDDLSLDCQVFFLQQLIVGTKLANFRECSDSGKKIMPIPSTRPGKICKANGTRHDASDCPVQPFGPTSVRGSNVGSAAVPPVYGMSSAHRVPPMYCVPYSSQYDTRIPRVMESC
jgi:hypothetical protein